MVDFGGWDMPVQYSAILDEHNAVRSAVGLFDVSHMGEIEIRGPEALELVDYVTTNAVSKLKYGQAQYSGLLYEHGGFVDDILVHKVDDDHYLPLCQRVESGEGLRAHLDAESLRRDGRVCQRAVCADRGPGTEGARHAAEADAHVDLETIQYYWFARRRS